MVTVGGERRARWVWHPDECFELLSAGARDYHVSTVISRRPKIKVTKILDKRPGNIGTSAGVILYE